MKCELGPQHQIIGVSVFQFSVSFIFRFLFKTKSVCKKISRVRGAKGKRGFLIFFAVTLKTPKQKKRNPKAPSLKKFRNDDLISCRDHKVAVNSIGIVHSHFKLVQSCIRQAVDNILVECRVVQLNRLVCVIGIRLVSDFITANVV